jgi:hypothetical protein
MQNSKAFIPLHHKKGTGLEGVAYVYLAAACAFVNKAMNLRVPQKACNFLSG